MSLIDTLSAQVSKAIVKAIADHGMSKYNNHKASNPDVEINTDFMECFIGECTKEAKASTPAPASNARPMQPPLNNHALPQQQYNNYNQQQQYNNYNQQYGAPAQQQSYGFNHAKCKAMKKSGGGQCTRNPVSGCNGMCRQHYNMSIASSQPQQQQQPVQHSQYSNHHQPPLSGYSQVQHSEYQGNNQNSYTPPSNDFSIPDVSNANLNKQINKVSADPVKQQHALTPPQTASQTVHVDEAMFEDDSDDDDNKSE